MKLMKKYDHPRAAMVKSAFGSTFVIIIIIIIIVIIIIIKHKKNNFTSPAPVSFSYQRNL